MTPSLRALLKMLKATREYRAGYALTSRYGGMRLDGDFERSVRERVRYEQGKQVSGMCERCVTQREMEEEHWRN